MTAFDKNPKEISDPRASASVPIDCSIWSYSDRFQRSSEREKVAGYSHCIILTLLCFTGASARTKINKSDKPGEMIIVSLYYRSESVLLSGCYRKIVNVAISWYLKKSSKVSRLSRILIYAITKQSKDTTLFTRASTSNTVGGDAFTKLVKTRIQQFFLVAWLCEKKYQNVLGASRILVYAITMLQTFVIAFSEP